MYVDVSIYSYFHIQL